MFQGQLLRNHPTEGEADDMNRLQAECTAESSAMSRHLNDRFGRFSSRSPDTRIVKENDFMILCETICY
jgi:hypothetical protein